MSNNSSSSSSGIGFGGALALLFIALKLLGKIGWSWWWVLAPLWIPCVVAGVILLIAGIVYLVASRIDKRRAVKPRARRNP